MSELYLVHHGISGQKWGKKNGPPYPLSPGDHSAEEIRLNKELQGKKAVTINKGSEIRRVSGKKSSDAKTMDKTYVTVGKKEADKFQTVIGNMAIRRSGEAWIHEYLNKEDIKIPPLHLQKKMERNLLKNPEVRNEVIESLKSIGYPEKKAIEYTRRHAVGKEVVKSVLITTAVGAGAGAIGGITSGPIAMAISSAVASTYSLLRSIPSIANYAKAYDKAVTVGISNAFGNIKNEKLNSAYTKALRDKGYNAFRDLNDRNNNMKSSTAIVLTDPNNTLKMEKSTKLSIDKYSESYLKYYKEKYPNTKMTDAEIKSEGRKIYKNAEEYYQNNKGGTT